MDRGAKTARTNAAAKRPVARKSRASGAATTRDLETRLAEALEQQAATNEILQLMAASPGDVQPVLDAVAERAARLCKAPFARVLLGDGRRAARRWRTIRGRRRKPDVRRSGRDEANLDFRPRGARRRNRSPRRHRSAARHRILRRPGKREAHRMPRGACGAADARSWRVRRDLPVAPRARSLRSRPGRVGADVCPAGSDRHRQRAPVQRGGGPQSRP